MRNDGGVGLQPTRWIPPRFSDSSSPTRTSHRQGDSSSAGRTSVWWEAEVGEGMTSLISFLELGAEAHQ